MVNFSRTNSCDHDRFGISSKRILQKPCKDWIAIWNKRLQQKKIQWKRRYLLTSIMRTPLLVMTFGFWQRGYYTYEWNEDPPPSPFDEWTQWARKLKKVQVKKKLVKSNKSISRNKLIFFNDNYIKNFVKLHFWQF